MAIIRGTVVACILAISTVQVTECSSYAVKSSPCMDYVCPEMNDDIHASEQPQPPNHHMAYSSCGYPRTSCSNYNPNQYLPRPAPPSIQPYGPPCPSFPYPPYPYPPVQMPQHPPSYCVQSVVVGGKAEVEEKRHNRTSSHGSNRISVDPRSITLDPSVGGNINVGANSAIDPGVNVNAAVDPGVNANGALDPSANTAGNRSAQIGAGGDPPANVDRYERYIERLLSALGNRGDGGSEYIPSPMMVVTSPSSSCRPVKTLRRRASRRYRLASCEEDDDPYVVVEDEDRQDRPSLFTASTCCRQPSTYCCCCRSKPGRRRTTCSCRSI